MLPTAHNLYLLVNRGSEAADVRTVTLRLPCERGMRYFDLYHGAEIDPEEDSDILLPSKCNEGRPDSGVPDGSYRNLDVDIETLGIGASRFG